MKNGVEFFKSNKKQEAIILSTNLGNLLYTDGL